MLVADASKIYKPGEKLVVKVISLDPKRRRIGLSVEGAKAAVERNEYLQYVSETKPQQQPQGKSAMALAFEKALRK